MPRPLFYFAEVFVLAVMDDRICQVPLGASCPAVDGEQIACNVCPWLLPRVCSRIAELRIARGLTQGQLAKLLRVAQTTVSAWERGVNEPSYMVVRKLVQLFGRSADYIMGYVDDGEEVPPCGGV